MNTNEIINKYKEVYPAAIAYKEAQTKVLENSEALNALFKVFQ